VKPDAARLIEDLAASIADGTAVDWTAVESGFGPEEQRLVRHLRLIDTLAVVYRSLPPDPEAPAEEDLLAAPEPAGPRWGRLILLDRIGQGTSADVFRAWDVDLQREVALKLLRADGTAADAGANARILREARRIARVRHPHVVHVYGAERHEERIGLWMELVRGRSLDEIVRTGGPIAADDAARIGTDLCGAVAAVHAAGLLHRDIKAQNVIRDESGRSVLMDFGAGEEIGAIDARVAGTPLYIAPEVLAGAAPSAASDIYALGVLLFYLTTGAFPVQAASIEELRQAHRFGTRRALRTINPKAPAALARVIERAISAEPAGRYASAAAMEADLARVARDDSRIGARMAGWRGWAGAAVTAAAVVALLATLNPLRTFSSRPVPEATSMAVLPLTFVSGGPEAALLADGLTDELITTLGQVKALRVTAHTSVTRFRGTTEPVSKIAEQLGVGSVLEGSIAVQSGTDPRVRVNLRLIRAGTDVELWSDSFDRPLANLLALERHIARAVAESVRGVLTQEESARFAQRTATSGPAQRAYLEAISYLAQNRRGAEVRPALEALQRAITIDPEFAAPHAAVARTYILLAGDGEIPQAEAYPAAKAAAHRALELDPGLPDAHVALADVSFYYEWDWAAAEAEYLRAIELGASDVRARRQYANLLAAMGRPDDARPQADRAVALDPLTADVVLQAGMIAYYQRRYDEARDILRRVTQMDPRFPGAYRMLARIEEARGNIADAIDLTNRALALSDYIPARAAALSLQAQAGQRSQAREGLAQMKSRLAAENRPLSPSYEAYVRLALGEREAALNLLSEAVASRDQAVLQMRVDPRLDPLRNDPRFQALLRTLGRP
jgi:TolB-like protein/Tfp pilus assembly protein PilF/tRNA A-37 threonylcarbamoyl transferase component Bud32